MTVERAAYAQSLTNNAMTGMLAGPLTILQWSFVRDDQARSTTSRQIALAIRDKLADLERAGIKIIQIDEAALREGLPLRRTDWKSYLDNAMEDFRRRGQGATGTHDTIGSLTPARLPTVRVLTKYIGNLGGSTR